MTTLEETQDKLKTNLFVSFRKGKNKENKICEKSSEGKKEEINYFAQRRLRRGSDPRLQTCRGKLQNKRSKLNVEINKELMLRAGAQNLLNASTNKRMREMVSLELRFFDKNLELLKEQLGELNSSVEVYQGNSPKSTIPMIPLGLKETKEIQFRDAFKDFILEHYSEDPSLYEEAITEFMELREAMRTPERDDSGVSLLLEYFNQLYFIDRRFFPPDRSLGIYFEWYDSLTGNPSCQRTVAFEKACVLFNVAALYTQLGARHDRSSAKGLDAAVNSFLRAAGMFKFLHETFSNAPSKDLSPEVLDTLIQLMMAQSRECLHEKALLSSKETTETLLELAQEAMHVSKEYLQVHRMISSPPVKGCVPPSWVSLLHIKAEHYSGRAHCHVAQALLSIHYIQEHLGSTTDEDPNDVALSQRAREQLMFLHATPTNNSTISVTMPTNRKERVLLGISHGREAIQVHEEALRLHRMCREWKRKKGFGLEDILRQSHDAAMGLMEEVGGEEEFATCLDPPPIAPQTKVQLSLADPDFSQHRVEDIFKGLGPVAVFSARQQWAPPRPVTITKTQTHGFGFAVKGDAPVLIASVDSGSLAEKAGIQQGDILVAICNRDVKWLAHEKVVSLIMECGKCLQLTLVTPCDKTYYKLPKSKSLKDLSPTSTTSSSSSSSGVSSQRSSSRLSQYGSMNSSTLSSSGNRDKRLSWNPFKKLPSRDKLKAESLTDCNVILR